jgi:hypothetical protein
MPAAGSTIPDVDCDHVVADVNQSRKREDSIHAIEIDPLFVFNFTIFSNVKEKKHL